MSVRRFAVIVAGGKGLRMGRDLPKQFIPIGGKPVLMHTLQRFASCDRIVLVLPEEHRAYWAELCDAYNFTLEHTIASGGETRFHSVHNGLLALAKEGIEPTDLVAIHDGVRPFASARLIDECFSTAEKTGSALPYTPMVDSLRKLGLSGASHSVNRSEYVAVQTPQTFVLSELLGLYDKGYEEHFTDDASVWESAGKPAPTLVESERENIKITTPLDLIIAEHLLAQTD